MAMLSKSKLIAYRQCPKRLWLEVHHPELRQDSAQTQASFQVGHSVGDVARKLYDPKARGTFLDIQKLGVAGVLEKTRELLPNRRLLFEAGFSIGTRESGALALADVLRPNRDGKSWDMIEVKSSTSVKDYHRDDAAIQYYIATRAGVSLKSLSLAYIDSSWVYPGGLAYQGLLAQEDLTSPSVLQEREVQRWISDAHRIAASAAPPQQRIGQQCGKPFECGFAHHCHAEDQRVNGIVAHPVEWLPGRRTAAMTELLESATPPRSLLDVPDSVLGKKQLRVKSQHASGKPFFDAKGAAQELAAHRLPALFLDFETINFAVPLWKGTRPYQAVPFQFSLHRLSRTGKLTHCGFLDLSGEDPSERIAAALARECGSSEPIYAYNKSFEGGRLEMLADRFRDWRKVLLAIRDRLVDLRPVAEAHYYHPAQCGSWSIKSVLPCIAPELKYSELGEVADGGGAMEAYREAIAQGTPAERKMQLREHLWAYCRLDTFAMVRLWAYFAGRATLVGCHDDATSREVKT
jgi:hypothetical protein